MIVDPIAIIGIGCRFPGANDPEGFWQILRDGVDAITEIPSNRCHEKPHHDFDSAEINWGGFLERVDRFAAEFFRISPQEAALLDPQQRLLLEVTWEALEDAGQVPEQLTGTNTGVFIGISSREYSWLVSNQGISTIDATTGNHGCMTANRISYNFDFRGPSLAINTACSSSLVAVDLACRSLWTGESTLALAGGVNLILLPQETTKFTKAGLIAADGRCKAFDAKADGYVRSEGVGVVVLKPLSQAQADGDRIYAVIKGSAVNQDGRSNGLTAPNLQAQVDLLQRAYQQADISPSSIHYIEAQGTGTPIGDVLEMKALGAVLGKNRSPEHPCRVGSVKTNIGHAEAASGIAGLIKVALCLQHRQIPPNLHFQQANPSIPFENLGLRVQQILEAFPEETAPIRAGVSAFGFGGTNAHVVLEEAPVCSNKSELQLTSQILTLSAKSEKALQALAHRYQEFLSNQPTVSLADICFTANTRRSLFKHRLVIVTESLEQLGYQLDAFVKGKSIENTKSGKVNSRKRPPIIFLFSGKESNSTQVIHELYNSQPYFRTCLDRCDELLRPKLGKSLLEFVEESFTTSSPRSSIPNSQLVVFVLEYALTQLWKFWGIEPVLVVGHGVGQYVAATLAGSFCLEDAVSLVARENLELLTEQELNIQPAKIPIISSITGTLVSKTEAISPQDWLKQLSESSVFSSKLTRLLQDQNSILLEVDFIQTITSINHQYPNQSVLSSLPETDNSLSGLGRLLSTLGELWLTGVKVNWSNVYAHEQYYPISLPKYPFEYQSYWFDSSTEVLQTEVDRKAISALNSIQPELKATFVSPRNNLECQLTQIWEDILGIQPIGVQDNFFDLGGNSLLAVRLFAQIEKKFGEKLPLASLFESGTVEVLAQIICQEELAASNQVLISDEALANSLSVNKSRISWSSLVRIQPEGSQPHGSCFKSGDPPNALPPLFCIHPLGGEILCYQSLAMHLGSKQPVYGLQPRGLDGKQLPLTQVKDMATNYLQEIKTIQQNGPYHLLGYSFGGVVAFEMAQQLYMQGEKVGLLVMLDTCLPGSQKRAPFPIRVVEHINNFLQQGPLYLQEKLMSWSEPGTRTIQKKYKRFLKKPEYLPEGDYHLRIMEANIQALNQYVFQAYPGQMTLFRTDDKKRDQCVGIQYEPMFGWSKLVAGEIDEYHVSGSHLSLLQEPNVRGLAEKLKICLARAYAVNGMVVSQK